MSTPAYVDPYYVDAYYVATAVISPNAILVIADADHSHAADAPTIGLRFVIAVADADHALSSEAAQILAHVLLQIPDAAHDGEADFVELAYQPFSAGISLVTVATRVVHPDGSPVAGAVVLTRLNRAAIDTSGVFVVPGTAHAETGADGTAGAVLWPNARGNWATHYDLRINALGAKSGRFEMTADGTDAHRALGLIVPPPAAPTRVVFAFDLVSTDAEGVEHVTPAAGLQVVVQPDRWDVVDDGFVAPITRHFVTDEQGIVTVDVLPSGALESEILVRVTDAAGRRRALRLRVPVAEAVSASSIELPDPCETAPRIVLREAA